MSDHAAPIWDALLATALLGTERRPLPTLLSDGPLGELLGQMASGEQEGTLLSQIAAVRLYQWAGSAPAPATAAPFEPCPPDTLLAVSGRAAQHLSQMLEGQHRESLPEWLQHVAASGRRAPDTLLPKLLELGRTQASLRRAIIPVLGTRGRWLASLNDEWDYGRGAAALDGDQDAIMKTWEISGRAARLALLGQARTERPKLARELIAATWSSEKADDRAAFIAVLADGLSMEDEPLLEAALDDRSKEVRRTAADLLGRLPNSALVRRMNERVTPLLRWSGGQRGRLLGALMGNRAQLDVTLPPDPDAALLRDGVERKPARPNLGEHAWVLQQMLRVVPPSTWSQRWNATPATIIATAAGSEWGALLLQSWIGAAERHRDAAWAEALLAASDSLPPEAPAETLLGVLPPERRESYLLRPLAANAPMVMTLLGQCTHPWSPAFARAVIRWVRGRVASDSRGQNWMMISQFKELAHYVPPELAPEFAEGWPTNKPGWPMWQGAVDRFLITLQFRHQMLQTLKNSHNGDTR